MGDFPHYPSEFPPALPDRVYRPPLIPSQCFTAYSGNTSIDMLSTPGAPLFALTCFHAFCRLSLSSTCATVTGLRECRSMMCRESTPPGGFIVVSELIEDLLSLLRSGLRSTDLLCPLLTSACLPACCHTGCCKVRHDYAHTYPAA